MNRPSYSPLFRSQSSSAEVAGDYRTFRVRKTSNEGVGAKCSILANRKIHYVPISGLKLRAKNPRTHSQRQIKQIARSIERFGFVNPILVDGNGQVICGHGRVAGARLLGLETVPTITLEHLSEPELRAYVITDNRLAEKAGWDKKILSIELEGLSDLGFDIEVTGFEIPEVELVIDEAASNTPKPNYDTLPKLDSNRVITKQGDLWILGDHRLICGDPRRLEIFTRLLSQDRAQLAFVSPLHGHYSASGCFDELKLAEVSSERPSGRLVKLLEETLGLLAEHSKDGAIHFICSDWVYMDEMLVAGRRAYHQLLDLVVWDKAISEKRSSYRSQHELIFVWKTRRGKYINAIKLKGRGRNRSNLWTYAIPKRSKGHGPDKLAMHSAVKPVALVADAILDCSRRGDVVLDSFGGSGTTMVACERTTRKARVIELDPIYCDQIIRHWQTFTGRHAINAANQVPFDEMDRT